MAIELAAAAEGDAQRAVRLWGAAAAARDARPDTMRAASFGVEPEAHVAAARVTLGVQRFTAAWAEWEALSLEQAIQDALGGA